MTDYFIGATVLLAGGFCLVLFGGMMIDALGMPQAIRATAVRTALSGGLVNVPAIVMGIPFLDFVQRIARKLRLAPNDSSPRFGD